MSSLQVVKTAEESVKHDLDINSLCYFSGRLYSGGDDGQIKVWTEDLAFVRQIQAHSCSVLDLTFMGTFLVSCSNDGTVKVWSLDDPKTLKLHQILIEDNQTEFTRLGFDHEILYVADDKGFVKLFKDFKHYGQFNIAEPVKDMVVQDAMVYTGRDLEIVVTEAKTSGKKFQFGMKSSLTGRAPLTLAGSNLVFSSREGTAILVHETRHFKLTSKIEPAHNLVINYLTAQQNEEKTIIYSGGWDKTLKKWVLDSSNVISSQACPLKHVINCISFGKTGSVFVGCADGHLLLVSET